MQAQLHISDSDSLIELSGPLSRTRHLAGLTQPNCEERPIEQRYRDWREYGWDVRCTRLERDIRPCDDS